MVHSHGCWQQVIMVLVTWASPLAIWVLVRKRGSSLGEIWKWTPYTKGKARLQKEADHFRLVGGSFNQQENLYRRFVLGGCKMSKSPHWPTRILKSLYVETLTGLLRTQSRWSQRRLPPSRPHPWNSSHCGNSGQNGHSKDRGGGGERLTARV